MKRHTAVWAALAAAILAALGPPASGQMRAIREDAGATAHQSIAGNGLPIDLVADAYGRAWTIQAVGTCGLYAEDAAHTSGETGQLIFAIRTNTRASLSGATGDYTPLQLTANGDLRVRDDDAIVLLGGGLPAALAANGGLKIEGVAGGVAVPVSGTVTANIGTVGTLATEASASAAAADLNELTAAPVVKVPTFLAAVIIGTPGTPGALAADGTFFRYAVLQAGRAAAANAALISIGGNTAYTSQRQTELAPGDTLVLEPPAGTKWDLNDFYIDGVNTDDGVRIMYVAP